MAVEQRNVSVAKEVDDVLALVVHVVKEVKAGKSAGDIASGSVAKLIAAMAGVDAVKDELAQSKGAVYNTVALRVSELVDALSA